MELEVYSLVHFSFDVVINADKKTILERLQFAYPESRILFGAEAFCWPDASLALEYLLITFGERFLNSGMFVGYASDVLKILNHAQSTKDDDDDQLFYTKLYLDPATRVRFYSSSKSSLDPNEEV